MTDFNWREVLAGLVAAAIGCVVLLRKMQVSWKNDGGNITAIETMQALVISLRDEITRLQNENKFLREKLTELEVRVAHLDRIVDRRQLAEAAP